MPKIRILPEILSNKIAAGEVVERPASVVKELVENALDAGATRIHIEVENGGRKRIRVSDNGCGMGSDDALLAIERYATSKIIKDHDLFSIRTLGFRGEALPSISAVSKFTLVTREADADVGTEVRISGGKVLKVSECGAPPGTMITVERLFFNTPARRKFMKTVTTEMGHIADMVASMALGWPAVRFRLQHNGKTVKRWAAAEDPMDRVADVLGAGLKSELFAVTCQDPHLSVRGWICSPRTNRSTSRGIFVFVNGRYVKDRIIQHALFEGYRGRLMKGQFPVAVLHLEIPFDEVDVNVHPTKHEVRFARQGQVHDTVRQVVFDTLRKADIPKWGRPDTVETGHTATGFAGKAMRFHGSGRDAFHGDFSENRGPLNAEMDFDPSLSPSTDDPFAESALHQRKEPHFPLIDASQPRRSEEFRPQADDRHPAQTRLWEKRRFRDLTVIGQFHDTFILCEDEQGLVIIDQHAAHERIAFEELKRRSGASKPVAQRQLVPETIELGFKETEILERIIPELGNFGLEIEPFGQNTFVVSAVPTLLSGRPMRPLVAELVEKIARIDIDTGMDQILDACLITMACHSTIRAHQRLSQEQMRGLLKQLDVCENPSHCPHGRPTWVRWTVKDLEKAFRRVV